MIEGKIISVVGSKITLTATDGKTYVATVKKGHGAPPDFKVTIDGQDNTVAGLKNDMNVKLRGVKADNVKVSNSVSICEDPISGIEATSAA